MVDFMERAFILGKEALEANEVPVGCVFTRNGKIIAESRNSVNETRNPTRHAEINCIDKVIDLCKQNYVQYDVFFKDVVVFVTVEPCIMCAAALKKLKVKEVIYGCANDRFGGNTVLNVGEIYDNGFKLIEHDKADEAMFLLKQFYKGTNPHAPVSKVKQKK